MNNDSPTLKSLNALQNTIEELIAADIDPLFVFSALKQAEADLLDRYPDMNK